MLKLKFAELIICKQLKWVHRWNVFCLKCFVVASIMRECAFTGCFREELGERGCRWSAVLFFVSWLALLCISWGGTSRSCALLLDVYGPLLLCCATCSFGVHFMRPLRWFYIFVKLSCFLCYGELYSAWPFREKRTLLSQHYKSFTGPLFCLKRWMGVRACLLSLLFIYVLVPLPNNAVNLQ